MLTQDIKLYADML